MKIVNAGYELINEESVTKQIERIARICYKSEGYIKDGTDVKMLGKLMENQHYAMFEHASLAYEVSTAVYQYIKLVKNDIMNLSTKSVKEASGLSRIRETTYEYEEDNIRCVVSGNIRAWIEFFNYCTKNRFSDDVFKPIIADLYEATKGVVDFRRPDADYTAINLHGAKRIEDFSTLSPAERMVHETFSALITADRGFSHEIVRMRDCSFAQESTRYCNYSNGKFGNEITVVKPVFFEEGSPAFCSWLAVCNTAETQYNYMINELGIPAQQARDVLPTSVKADIAVTANLQEWRHVFELRACDLTGPAHPQMKEVMCPLCVEMMEKYPFAFGDLEPDMSYVHGYEKEEIEKI